MKLSDCALIKVAGLANKACTCVFTSCTNLTWVYNFNFKVFAALIQLGIAQEMLLSLWQGFIYFFVLAGAIAFGLGGKDAAADLISGLRKQLPKK